MVRVAVAPEGGPLPVSTERPPTRKMGKFMCEPPGATLLRGGGPSVHGCRSRRGRGLHDASVIEADASRYHGKAPGEIDWSAPERQTRAVAEF